VAKLTLGSSHPNMKLGRASLGRLSDRQSETLDALSRSSNEITSAFIRSRDNFATTLQSESQKILRLQRHTSSQISQLEKTNTYILDTLLAPDRARRIDIAMQPSGTRVTRQVKEVLIENLILNKLGFPTLRDRLEEVAEAHRSTFSWLLGQSNQRVYSSFPKWLTQGGGIYWINGKAGSGKSTLMRFLFDHPECKRLLQVWANGVPTEIAAFFFWNSGTVEQRSQSGLLRSLLYEVIRKHRELIPLVFSERWSLAGTLGVDKISEHPLEPWSLSELKRAFQRFVYQQQISLKVVLFIDGLDEYSGDHLEMIQLFQSISALPNIKVCVSSRPLLVFEDAFSDTSSLKLQDLTRSDIETYINDKLIADSRMIRFSQNSPEVQQLVREITNNAGGVFLWVILVVKTLLDGLQNRDRISDLGCV
jgi:hypothetical protein